MALLLREKSASGKEYVAIEMERIRPDTLVGCNLYLRLRDDGNAVLYKRRDMPVTFQEMERLISNNVRSLFVDAEDEHILREYVESNLSYYLQDENMSPEEKSSLFYECATYRVREILKDPESSENFKRSKVIVENAVNYILSEKKALHSLMQLMSYDYYTYTHSVNVCTFSVALARFAGEKSKTVLNNVGLGALLHDVGKSKIPGEILNKRGALTDEEMALIKKHPLFGLEIVGRILPYPGIVGLITVQHHEKCDGSGYPFGKNEGTIHPYGKMACVVDIFDALTTRRPYKEALKTFPALKLMKEELQGKLDNHFFNKFVRLLEK